MLRTTPKVLAVAVFAVFPAVFASPARGPFLPVENDGDASTFSVRQRAALAAAFTRESYRSGDTARLVVRGRAHNVMVQIFRAGAKPDRLVASNVMTGAFVANVGWIANVDGRATLRLTLGDWGSGVYYARLAAGRGRIGYAPFVLRPRRLGEHTVAVVLPTQTWQAYNVRDGNGDGKGDSWYADPRRHTASLGRPFLDRGVPPHWKSNDLPFLQWLLATKRGVDYLADADLSRVPNGARLRNAYELVVFPGHHEYVTRHEYDVVRGYRNHGGNLMFLSANNFFWQIVRRGPLMIRTRQWRDLGRPEASLIGVEYFHNDRGAHRAPWVIRPSAANAWLLAGTGLAPGSKISSGGIEGDRLAPASPAGVEVLAEIPNLYGPGMTPQMTYYESRRGAKVFAAGAFGLTGAVSDPRVSRLLANVWRHLTDDGAATDPLDDVKPVRRG
jgi:hypothetical protein